MDGAEEVYVALACDLMPTALRRRLGRRRRSGRLRRSARTGAYKGVWSDGSKPTRAMKRTALRSARGRCLVQIAAPRYDALLPAGAKLIDLTAEGARHAP